MLAPCVQMFGFRAHSASVALRGPYAVLIGQMHERCIAKSVMLYINLPFLIHLKGIPVGEAQANIAIRKRLAQNHELASELPFVSK